MASADVQWSRQTSSSGRVKVKLTADREKFQHRGDRSKAVHRASVQLFIRSLSFQLWSPHGQYKTEGRCQSLSV